eukprot:scaffold6641_cov118-Isochrysis_galbana.AAC.3
MCAGTRARWVVRSSGSCRSRASISSVRASSSNPAQKRSYPSRSAGARDRAAPPSAESDRTRAAKRAAAASEVSGGAVGPAARAVPRARSAPTASSACDGGAQAEDPRRPEALAELRGAGGQSLFGSAEIGALRQLRQLGAHARRATHHLARAAAHPRADVRRLQPAFDVLDLVLGHLRDRLAVLDQLARELTQPLPQLPKKGAPRRHRAVGRPATAASCSRFVALLT